MNLDFSDDQKLLKDQLRKFFTDKSPPAVVRRVLEGEESYDQALWAGMVEMGLMGTAIPEEHGGVGLGMLELCVIAEELGRAVAPVPFSSSIYVAAEALKLAEVQEAKQALKRLASGESIGTFAFSEGAGAATFGNLKTRFDGEKLTGKKIPVPDGLAADHAIVSAQNREGKPALLLASLTSSHVQRDYVETIDPARKHAAINFDKSPAHLLAEGEDAREMMEEVMNRAAVLFAFEQLGGSEGALEMARTYATERHAFGRPIGSFQAIKHKMADIYVKNELARSNCYYAAMTLGGEAGAGGAANGESVNLPLAAATARISASESFIFAAQENVQIHGGIGFTWESDCQFFYRRARGLSLALGAPRRWKEKAVRLLEMRNV